MLAEPKTKEVWSQDPRNTFWSKDKSKFGYRMLQRMGWSEEKGLGKEEEGRTDHVKVHRKRDCSGVGASKGRDEGWIQHQDTFDEILAGLNKQEVECDKGDETVNKSIIENATESRRIVYKRFLRSKDLSAASSEELDCVLGRKRRKHSSTHRDSKKTKTIPTTESEAGTCSVSNESDIQVTTHGITTVTNNQSVQDYFSAKMTKLKQHKSEQKEHRRKQSKQRTK